VVVLVLVMVMVMVLVLVGFGFCVLGVRGWEGEWTFPRCFFIPRFLGSLIPRFVFHRWYAEEKVSFLNC
jgi:hypothetical protein